MEHIRAVVFDIGGVLEITPETGFMERWATRLNMPDLRKRAGSAWDDGALNPLSEAEVYQRLVDATGMTPEHANQFIEDFWAWYLGTLNRELTRFFAGLRPQYKTGILSNSFAGARKREQAAYGFEDMVDVMVYSHEVGIAKPDPRIYAMTCRRLGVQPSEMIFLDDAEPNINAARDFGIRAILFQETAQAIRAIQDCLRDDSGRP